MSGLEDGLLLFNGQGRAVLVEESPSVERFLGGRSDDFGAASASAKSFRRATQCAPC